MISNSHPDSDRVLADLGDTFVTAFVDAVDGSRADYAEFRSWKPGWFPGFTQRFTANFLHERIWDRVIKAVAQLESVHIVDREPVRELRSGTQYLIRVKRHHPGDRISAYPTEASSAFWSNSSLMLEGLESFSLALGYMWDAELRSVGDAVLSFRDGKDHPIWAIQLQKDASAPSGFTWAPVAPELPELDLTNVIREAEEESGT